MSVDFSSPDIHAAVDAFHAGSVSWLVLGYSPQRDQLVLLESGADDDLAGCRRALDQVGEDVAYGFVRAQDRTGVVTFLGEGVGGVKRARALVHGRLLSSNLFTPNGGSLTINASSELTSSLLLSSLDVPSPPPTPNPNDSRSAASAPSPTPSGPSSTTVRPPPAIRTASGSPPASRPRTPELQTGLASPLISATSPSPSQTTRNLYTPPATVPPPSFAPQQQQQQQSSAGQELSTVTDERDAAGAEPHVNGSHSTTNGHSPAQPLSAASPDAALPIASSSNHYAPASLPEPSSAAPPASNNPMARLAKLEASRPASAAPSSPTSATTTAATVAPLPAPPPSPTPQVAPARASVPVGRPSIPLFSSLSLSARKPANGDAASPGGGGARGRITSFGSLRERFSSRSTRGKNVQRDEDGPPALPPKDGQYGAPTPIHERETQTAASPAVKAAAAARRTSELFPIGVDNGPSFASAFTPAPAAPTTTTTTTADADARAKQEWDDAYDDGYAYDLSPPSAPLAPVVELGRELEPAPSPTAAPAAPAVEDDGAQENERRVSASTFGRPSSTGVTASSSFDTLGSPPVPPLAARPLPPAASPDVPAAAPAPPIGNGAAPVGESVLHRRRPSHDFHPSPAVSNGFAAADEGPTTAHWLQSREDDRRADDNALLPDAVASRRAASGHGAVAPDPWEALDARRAEREAVRVRVEAEARERKRLRELAAEREAKERVAREEERVRAARERTREVERERREKEEREAREREQVEAARVQREKAREGSVPPETAGAKGGRLADGWLTVQAPNTVIFRRRFFHILPSVIHLFKDSTSTDTPIATIRLAPTANPDLADAYEETQVLHSFGIADVDGAVWLAYLDSESDKELVVAALTIASQ